MKTLNQIETKLKQLEQKHSPIQRYPVCFVNSDEDENEVVAKHMDKYPRPPGSHLHVVSFKKPVK